MRTRNQILAERKALLDEGTAILDQADATDRELTEKEQKRYDEIVAAVQTMNAELGDDSRPTLRPQPGNMAHLDEEILPLGARAQRARIPAHLNHARLQVYANTPKGREEAYRSGMWVMATLLGDAKATLSKLVNEMKQL